MTPASMATWNTGSRISGLAFRGLLFRSGTGDGTSHGKPWAGRIWANPPYGRRAEPFLEKLAKHGDGVALLFARTETAMFHKYVWSEADALLFLKGRLYFHRPDGTRAPGNAGGPSVLIAYGAKNASALENSGLVGAFVPLAKSNHLHSKN